MQNGDAWPLLTAAAAVCLVLAGCSDSADHVPSAVAADATEPEAALSQTLRAAQPSDILVEVNGEKLTRLEVETDLKYRMAGLEKRTPSGRRPEVRTRMFRHIIEQFVIRRLLLEEADRLGIDVREEDKSEAYAKIAAGLPEGTTLEQAMQNSPMGKERMREEVVAGLKITKLLALQTSNAVSVTDREVADFREKNRQNLNRPEKVRARHILISVDAADDDDVKAEKRKRIDGIRNDLLEDADFAGMAKQHSSCPSRQRGGDLGVFGRGQMVKEFEDAAFGQKVGAIGPVIQTKFGYHIVQVLQHDQPGPLSADKIRAMLAKQKQRDATGDLLERLRQGANIRFAPELKQ